jgi:hypothetical protein
LRPNEHASPFFIGKIAHPLQAHEEGMTKGSGSLRWFDRSRNHVSNE